MLQDGVEDVYMFLDDIEGASDSRFEQEELPTGVITLLTKCYSSSCDDENPCYSFACPRRVSSLFFCWYVVGIGLMFGCRGRLWVRFLLWRRIRMKRR